MDKITSESPLSKSADLTAENLEKLKRLFPEAFHEGGIDFDVLRRLLGGAVDEGQEKYGLSWRGKRQSRRRALTPSAGTLRPCPEESRNWDAAGNLYIEGDNLEVLPGIPARWRLHEAGTQNQQLEHQDDIPGRPALDLRSFSRIWLNSGRNIFQSTN
jgi:hypothetical protein